ncbi:hypothetical protein ID858_12540 [Xenorhabdus sp. DI]|uniref:hypothetical protein n=1 Tax=Xenorhabdus doucetiae TaxID=351671 RepID=UPI0019A890FA|nr:MULTISPECIES: hypothetical protein [unclassified Xenorhabdus]MBD2785482.1 hypothetical protein [Xenorhabdus sp. 3]MBD2789335.1 hypothetical protein [Xenorhabdus sp. DI]MBD2797660.1 hypothetical protein [Xenorhabdus sp. 18]
MDEYQNIELLKLQLLQLREIQAKADMEAGKRVNGDEFFDQLEARKHDQVLFI